MDDSAFTMTGTRSTGAASAPASEVAPALPSELAVLSEAPPAAPMPLSAGLPGALRLAARAWRTALPLAAAGWGVLYVAGLVAMQLLPGGEDDWSAAGAVMLLAAPAAFTPLLLALLAHAGRAPSASHASADGRHADGPAHGGTAPSGAPGAARIGAPQDAPTPCGTMAAPHRGGASYASSHFGSLAALRLGMQRAPAMLAGGVSYAGVVAFGTGMVIVPGLLAAMMFGLWWVAAAERGAGLFDAARASSDAFALGWLRISALLGLSGALLVFACVAAPAPYTLAGALVDAALLLAAPILHCAFLTVAWHDACQRASDTAEATAPALSRAA